MSGVVQPPARVGFDWPGLDLDTLDAELSNADPDQEDLAPFERMRQEMD